MAWVSNNYKPNFHGGWHAQKSNRYIWMPCSPALKAEGILRRQMPLDPKAFDAMTKAMNAGWILEQYHQTGPNAGKYQFDEASTVWREVTYHFSTIAIEQHRAKLLINESAAIWDNQFGDATVTFTAKVYGFTTQGQKQKAIIRSEQSRVGANFFRMLVNTLG
jgi:hypothetical protein